MHSTTQCQAVKRTVLILFTHLLVLSSFAQQLDFFGGLSSTALPNRAPGQAKDGSGTIGYQFGLALFAPFHPKAFQKDASGEGYGLYPALQYIRKGAAKSTMISGAAADVKINYLQLNLPLAFTSAGYGFGIGPYAALAMGGTKKFRVGGAGKEKINFSTDVKKLDYGLGIQIQLPMFRFQYDLGLANISKLSGYSTKTRSFSLSINIPLVE
jgi:hypothetical protein